MTEHKATPQQWSDIERFVRDCGYDSCLLELRSRVEALEAGLTTVSLELRDRVEALEAAAKPAESNYPAPSHSLVERVADTIYINAMGGVCEQARAAILEIAAWLREQSPDAHLFNAGLFLDRELE